jgi:Fe-S cluster assembly protein SufD
MDGTRFADEPGFWRERRQAAEAVVASAALPERSVHRWRFTDPAALLPAGAATVAEALGRATGAWEVGIEVPESARAAGVEAMTLAEARVRHPALVAEHLGRLAGTGDPFVALNLAAFAGGAFVRVPAGVEAAEAVVLRASPAPGAGVLAAGRTLIVLERGARATVLEELDVASGTASAVTEVVVADGAALVHARFEAVAKDAAAFSRTAQAVGRDASVTDVHVLLPTGLLKSESAPVLAGTGAAYEGYALALGGGRSRADFRVVADHAVGDTNSRVTVRAVALGKAKAAFTGLLQIREGAARSEAFEEARALLLSRTASADLLPELEILNHDVRCSHGAAVAPVDEETLFYLQTRGLARSEAEAMMVEGFVEPVAARLPSEALAERARERLRAELAAARGL